MSEDNEIGIIYGQYRLDIAAHFGIDPAEVTGEHVDAYEKEKGQ